MRGYQIPEEVVGGPCERDGGIRKVAVVIEYNGAGYCGFQRQLSEPTIQAELESVLYRITQQVCVVRGAGRTDSGVHARGQIVHFQTKWKHSWAELLRAMNALLPNDVSALRIFPVSVDFDARYSAISRVYRYVIYNRKVRSPFITHLAHRIERRLDVQAMNLGSACLVGAHDFSSFGQSPSGGHTIREVYGAYWCCQGDWVFFDIEANGFLRHMVRSLVGTLIQVGLGKMSPTEMAQILRGQDRSLAGPTAPPHGLYLEKICYRAPWQGIV